MISRGDYPGPVQWHHVGYRISDDGVRSFDGRIPGGNVDGRGMLSPGGVGVDARVSATAGSERSVASR